MKLNLSSFNKFLFQALKLGLTAASTKMSMISQLMIMVEKSLDGDQKIFGW